jgi:hypothetical protein
MGKWLLLLVAAAGCDAAIGAGGVRPDAAPLPTVDGAPLAAPAPDAEVPVELPECTGGDDRVQDEDSGDCYLYFQTAQTWADAQAACEALDARLAFIGSVEENLLIGTITPAEAGLQDIWVGGTDSAKEAEWRWLAAGPIYYDGGVAVGYVNWRTGEPNNSAGVEHCMILERDTPNEEGPTWDDRDCGSVYPYMCERPGP